jgi:chromosomal replication initiator protein
LAATNLDQILSFSRQAVLRFEQGCQVDVRSSRQQLATVPQPAIDGRGVRHEADPQAMEWSKGLIAEYFKAGTHACLWGHDRRQTWAFWEFNRCRKVGSQRPGVKLVVPANRVVPRLGGSGFLGALTRLRLPGFSILLSTTQVLNPEELTWLCLSFTLPSNFAIILLSSLLPKTGENRIENRTFARYVQTPENRPALLAVRDVAACVCSGNSARATNPLYLHGPAGTGKTHLIAALVDEVTRRSPQLIVTILQAGDLEGIQRSWETRGEAEVGLCAAKESNLFVVEDLQHLSAGRRDPADGAASQLLIQIFDSLYTRRRQLVFTALLGPRGLRHLPTRLLSRLGCGLVVGLLPMQMPSRLALLQDKAQRRQLAVSLEVLTWLAKHLSSGRQLEGAVVQLEALARLHEGPLDVPTVARHFQQFVRANRLTVQRIAQQVGSYFRIDPRHLQSRRRYRNVMVPRQIGMYLARQLTDLSLDEIGSHFGGRDHSTVLHACRKIKGALVDDAAISGAVQQLQVELL